MVPASQSVTGLLREPPLLCVEVLSPEDRFQRVILRAQEYQRMGVPHIWILDPKSREAWVMGAEDGPVPMMDDAFTLPGTQVRLPMSEIFAEIDEAPQA